MAGYERPQSFTDSGRLDERTQAVFHRKSAVTGYQPRASLKQKAFPSSNRQTEMSEPDHFAGI
jgi:hypothetical protein